LPGPSAGSAVVLVPPYEKTLDAFFSSGSIHVHTTYTSTRLGGEPFHLYVVDPLPQAAAQETLSSDLQFVSARVQKLDCTGLWYSKADIYQSSCMRKSSFSSNVHHMVFSYACSKAEDVQKHHPAK
jgi:hypothetical protein